MVKNLKKNSQKIEKMAKNSHKIGKMVKNLKKMVPEPVPELFYATGFTIIENLSLPFPTQIVPHIYYILCIKNS